MRKEMYQEERKERYDTYSKKLDDRYQITSRSYQNLSAPGIKIKEHKVNKEYYEAVTSSRELTIHREPMNPVILGGNNDFIIRNETLKKMYRSPSVSDII